MIVSHEFEVGGKTLSVETGRVANQAGGAVLLGMGETVILGTATMSEKPREGIDFLPLVCDYEERKYAVGKIPGGFIKRSGRPSEKATLVSRLIDRPLRPLFPKGLRHDLQVIAMTFAVDQDCPPDVLAICAAGAALTVSDIPFNGPVAGVRVGMIDGEFILFPTQDQIKASDLDLCVAGHKGAISMVEAGANFVTEDVMHKALKFAHEAIHTICVEFEKFGKMANKPKREVTLHAIDENLKKAIDKKFGKEISKVLLGSKDKAMRESALDDLIRDIVTQMKPDYADQPELLAQLSEAADTVVKGVVRELIIKKDSRPDGRGLDQLRKITAEAGLLPKVHGSGLFSRGQTQVMTVLTMGMPGDAQTMDGLENEDNKRYMHFYNFPAYSVGEVRPSRGPGRREIGHGALAERALRPVVPIDDPKFPYTLLLTSEVLESNGSTSMASVCGSTLALLDAGIQIKAPVAGIAMGLMSDGKVFKVLTDIIGMEDFCGDMDFKVAGTREGITALQLDTKLDGIPDDVLGRALNQAKTARLEILDVIEAEIAKPRETFASSAPQITTLNINPEKIGALIGPGGANIKKITSTTGASVDIQQDGTVLVGASDGRIVQEAVAMVKALTDEVTVGSEFVGKITRIMGKGVLVEFIAGREGLVPIEHLVGKEIGRAEDVVAVGDELRVRVNEIDFMNRINFSALGLEQSIEALKDNVNVTAPVMQPRPGPSRDRGGDRGGRGGDRGRDRGDRGDRGGDRGGRGNDRGRHDRGPRNESPKPEAVSEGSSSDSNEEDVNARFRPRR